MVALPDLPRAFVHLGAELFTLHSRVADQGCYLGELAIRGWLQGVASGIADGDWFGRTQGLDLPPGVAAAQFGVGGDGQAPGSFGGVLPFLPGGCGCFATPTTPIQPGHPRTSERNCD